MSSRSARKGEIYLLQRSTYQLEARRAGETRTIGEFSIEVDWIDIDGELQAQPASRWNRLDTWPTRRQRRNREIYFLRPIAEVWASQGASRTLRIACARRCSFSFSSTWCT